MVLRRFRFRTFDSGIHMDCRSAAEQNGSFQLIRPTRAANGCRLLCEQHRGDAEPSSFLWP